MKRVMLFVNDQPTSDDFNRDLEKGWVIDPLFGKPLFSEQGLIVPLVKYDSEDERPKPEAEPEKPGEFEDVVETRDIPHGSVPEGFTVHALYAKSMIVIKRKLPDTIPVSIPADILTDLEKEAA